MRVYWPDAAMSQDSLPLRNEPRFPVEAKHAQLTCAIAGVAVGDISRTGLFLQNAPTLKAGDFLDFSLKISLVTYQKEMNLRGEVMRVTPRGAGLVLRFDAPARQAEWASLVAAYEQFLRKARAHDLLVRLERPVEVQLQGTGAPISGSIKEVGESSALVSALGLDLQNAMKLKLVDFRSGRETVFQIRVTSFTPEGYNVQFENLSLLQKEVLRGLVTLSQTAEPAPARETGKVKLDYDAVQYLELYQREISQEVLVLKGIPSVAKGATVQAQMRVRAGKKTLYLAVEGAVARVTLGGDKVLKLRAADTDVMARAARIAEDCEASVRGRGFLARIPLRPAAFILAGGVALSIAYRYYPVSTAPVAPDGDEEDARFVEQAVRFKFVAHLGLGSQQIKAGGEAPPFDVKDVQSVKYDPMSGKCWLKLANKREIELADFIRNQLPTELLKVVDALSPPPPPTVSEQGS